MPEAAAVRWSPAQQSMLRELGCELFAVRGADAAAVDGESSSATNGKAGADTGARGLANGSANTGAAAQTRSARRLLVVLSPDANWLRGPHAKLARGVLAALGVPEADVRGEPVPGAPALAFGIEAPGALLAPALDALRDARAKRALWPALRALRRRLRDPGAQR